MKTVSLLTVFLSQAACVCVARWSFFWRCFFSMLVQLFIGSVLGFCVFFSNVSSGLLVPEGSLAKGSKELAYAGGCVLL
jgi:hypothetical protein